MKLYAAVVNTYGKVGQEFVDFCSVLDSNSCGKGCGRSLSNLLSLLGIYANAEKIILSHAPSRKRALNGDVLAAIAAKEAGAKSPPLNPAAEDANAEATSSQESATQKTHPKSVRCPEFRGDITCVDGQKKIFCKKCKHSVSYNGWGQHCTAHHSEKDHTDIVDQ